MKKNLNPPKEYTWDELEVMDNIFKLKFSILEDTELLSKDTRKLLLRKIKVNSISS